jgi:hypothetical protein
VWGARVFGLRVLLDIEASQTRGATDEKEKSQKLAGALKLIEGRIAYGSSDKLHAPRVSQNGGGNAETDDVGEGIQFAAEVAGGIRHARNAAVETIQNGGESDAKRGKLEALGRRCRICGKTDDALNGPDDRQITEKNVAGRKQRGEGVSGSRRTAAR